MIRVNGSNKLPAMAFDVNDCFRKLNWFVPCNVIVAANTNVLSLNQYMTRNTIFADPEFIMYTCSV